MDDIPSTEYGNNVTTAVYADATSVGFSVTQPKYRVI